MQRADRHPHHDRQKVTQDLIPFFLSLFSLHPSLFKRRRQESNLIFELRGLACESGTLRRHGLSFSTPPRNRTSSGRFEVCHAVHHTRRASSISQYPDLDLNQGLDLRRVQCYPLHHRDMLTSRSSVPTWIRTRTKTLGRSCAVRYTIGTSLPSRADDWIRTSINRPKKTAQSRPAPFSVEPRRQSSTSARSRTPSASFGGWLLSQEHTRE